MAGELVFITGGSGLVGIKAIHLALQYGYRVRAAVRDQSKAKAILATPTVKAFSPTSDQLSFAIVPDMLAADPYDEAIKGVKFILHIASPTFHGREYTQEELETDLVQPAIKGTLAILTAAVKTPSVKRVVITSSEVAIIPWEEFIAKEVDTVFNDASTIPTPMGPYQNPFEAYSAGKTRALHATLDFMAKEKPAFDIIHIMPGFIIGANELVTDADKVADGTVAAALAPVLGKDSGWGSVPSTSVLVDDVAELHIRALDPKIEGNQSFLAVSERQNGGTKWEQALDIAAKWYPQAVKKGVLPNNGPVSTKKTLVDPSRTEKVFGFQFKSFETQVRSAVDQYLKLRGEPLA